MDSSPPYRSLILDEIGSLYDDSHGCFYDDLPDDQGRSSHTQLMAEAKVISKRLSMLIYHVISLHVGGKPPVVCIQGRLSTDVVRCMLAVLCSNAAFLLLDPNLPGSRIRDVINESSACLVISTMPLMHMPLDLPIRIITLAELQDITRDEDISAVTARNQEIIPPCSHSPVLPFSHLIFTSGSTGKRGQGVRGYL